MKTIKFQKQLFKVHSSGKVGNWVITVSDNGDGTATIAKHSTKVIGGTPVETITHITEGKNIGRANETTPIAQALAQANSNISKQLDRGYVEDMPQAGEKATNALGLPKPMLAQPMDDVAGWDFPVYAQPKLDGHRMLAVIRDGGVLCYSRGGKEINLPHIKESLQRAFDIGEWCGNVLDGELYCHGVPLQTIGSWVKRIQPDTLRLTYYVYDSVQNQAFPDRHKYLMDTFGRNQHASIVVLPHCMIDTKQSLDYFHASCLKDGYEGSIVRWGGEDYEDGKRSKYLMKRKDFEDAEFLVVDATFGNPYIKGDVTYLNPILICEIEPGKTFEVVAPGSMEEKHAIGLRVEQLKGKAKLTVKFFGFTLAGVPNLPVGLRFRDDI